MDSRVVLDSMGAEKLLGSGDMLFLWPGTSTLLRGQGTYLSDDEIDSITESVSTGEQNFVHELINIKVEKNDDDEGASDAIRKRDDMYAQAVDVVVSEQRGSVSLLQRHLGIGYGRAARLIDFMEEDGFVGPYNGSKSREVLLTPDRWAQIQAGDSEGSDQEPESEAGSPPAAMTRIEKHRQSKLAANTSVEVVEPESGMEKSADAEPLDDDGDEDLEEEYEDEEYEDEEYEDEEYEEVLEEPEMTYDEDEEEEEEEYDEDEEEEEFEEEEEDEYEEESDDEDGDYDEDEEEYEE
jgi:S-DNA-T family DNA segregation ATPase FtsK/SpoIIIE